MERRNAICVREMRPGDTSRLAALAEEGFRDSYVFDWRANAEALSRGVQKGSVYVAVAEDGGDVVGYCNLRAWPAGGWIDQIAVDGQCRRRGIARLLFQHVVQAARARGYWKISLIVSEKNVAALEFFRSAGMQTVGRMTDEIRRGVDGVLLSYVTD